MIHFITGRPGGGKSYYALRQILFELQHTDRFIVTNLALHTGALAEWCHENKARGDLRERLRTLSDVESREFWLYQGPGRLHEKRVTIKAGSHESSYPDFSDRDPVGVLYVIDEVHIHFPAREWFKTGTDCTFYLSQHRKFGDDVLLITQSPEQVDKGLRRLAADFTVLRNMGQEKVAGFVAKGWLRRATYLFPKTKGDHQPPQETGLVRLDISGLGKLYDTNSGIGVVGRVDARGESKVKGMPIWFAPVAAVAVLVGLYFGVGALTSAFRWGVNKAIGGFRSGIKQTVGRSVGITNGVETASASSLGALVGSVGLGMGPASPAPSAAVAVVFPQKAASESDAVKMTGFLQYGGEVWVSLTDGRILRASDLAEVRSTWCADRFGRVYPLETRPERVQRLKSAGPAPMPFGGWR